MPRRTNGKKGSKKNDEEGGQEEGSEEENCQEGRQENSQESCQKDGRQEGRKEALGPARLKEKEGRIMSPLFFCTKPNPLQPTGSTALSSI